MKQLSPKQKRDKDRRERLLLAGKCPNHCDRDAAPGRAVCQECLDNKARRYSERKREGVCVYHLDRKVLPGQTMCQECADLVKQQSKERRERLIAEGKCVNHPGHNAVSGKTQCRECRDTDKVRVKACIAKGKCPNHSDRDVVRGRKSCQECLDESIERNTNIHTPRRRARKLLVPNEQVDRRVVFARDKNICQHCGKTCNGDTCADHIIPLSAGGPHCCWNFQTLCAACNGAKGADIRKEPKLAHLLHLPIRKLIEAFAKEQGATLPRGWWEARSKVA